MAILGPLEVRDGNGQPVAIAGTKLRSLLCRLALDVPDAVSPAALVTAVWQLDRPADEANALQTLVSRLRRVLGDAGIIAQSAAGYRLALSAAAVDAHRFERLAADGRAALADGDAAGASAILEQALALWRGPALAGAGEFAEIPAGRLEGLRLLAVLDRIDADLLLGRAPGMLPELQALAAEHPLNERIAGQLISALAAAGRQADALSAYDSVREVLSEELGVDPATELQAVRLAVLRGEFGTPEPPRPRQTNLRAQLTSFIGRDDEVARIGKALEENRLVTLVGPGGAGKTRLANEAAARIVEPETDGIWLVELAPVTDPGDLPQTVLGSFGIRQGHLLDRRNQLTGMDAAGRLQETLADKNVVLILDNCEHLVDATAQLADQLLGHCPGLRVLTTSREPLGIVGEVLLAVAPLTQPAADATAKDALDYPAVQLFVDRASAVQPEFVLDDAAASLVVAIVRRLDGLPLAIELAAARLRNLPLGEIAERLSDRFRLLTGGSRTAMPRHRTLRAVVEWSWELLNPAERTLVERLAVFPAGATSASASAVCADEVVLLDEVPDLLAALVDKSLLQPVDGGSRLRLLETIREYGIERLAESAELARLRARHAAYFRDLMRRAEPELVGAGQLPWFDLLTAERDNVMAALRYYGDVGNADGALEIAVSAASFAMLLGNHAEVPVWIGEALKIPGWTDPGLHWLAKGLYGMTLTMTEMQVDTVAAGMQILAQIEDQLDAVDLHAHPITALLRAAVAFFTDDTERVQRYVAETASSGHRWAAASTLMFRANLAENNGDQVASRADLSAALVEFRQLGERWGTANVLRAMAQIRTLDGDLDGAMSDYEEALRLMAEMRSRDDEAFLRTRMADLYVRRGDLDGARDQIKLAQATIQATGSSIESAFTLCTWAEVERRAGNLVTARKLHEQALARLASIPARHPIQGHSASFVLSLSARMALADGDLTAARERLGKAYVAAVGTKDRPVTAAVGTVIAELFAESEPARAARMLGAAARLRGAADATSDDIRQLSTVLKAALGADQFAANYGHGQSLDFPAAIALLDPS